MAKPDLGTKRICPETGRKFYDLNKDPIVSPYTGTSYPLSYFQSAGAPKEEKKDEVKEKEVETEEEGAETISLEEADKEAGATTDGEAEDDVDLGDNEQDDTFLASDDDDDEDVSGIIEVEDGDED